MQVAFEFNEDARPLLILLRFKGFERYASFPVVLPKRYLAVRRRLDEEELGAAVHEEEELCVALMVRVCSDDDFLREIMFGNKNALPYNAQRLWESLKAGEDCGFAFRDALLEAGHTDLADIMFGT